MANKTTSKITVRNIFQESVEATADIAKGFCKGLQALKSNSTAVSTKNDRQITGSVDIDTMTKTLYPTASRWDYAIGYEDKAYFLEIHPANTSNVSEMINKKNWLENWLISKAPALRSIKADAPYYWVPSGKNAILKTSRQYRQIAQNHIHVVNKLEL